MDLKIVCVVLLVLWILAVLKIISLRRAAVELEQEFAARQNEDTNTGICISTADAKMRQLASGMDRELKHLRRARIRYENGDAELKSTITNVSHDLRTPLTAICGYLELLEREDMSDTVREYLTVIKNRVRTMQELTEELLLYSVVMAPESAKEKEKKEPVSLNAALEEAVCAFYGAFTERGITPEITMTEQKVVRSLERQALSRILSNIISNALKYSDGDFLVCLTADGEIHFCNRAEKLDKVQVGHLFERFYTVQSGDGGVGLGLSIAKNLTEEMGGEIKAWYEEGKLHIRLKF